MYGYETSLYEEMCWWQGLGIEKEEKEKKTENRLPQCFYTRHQTFQLKLMQLVYGREKSILKAVKWFVLLVDVYLWNYLLWKIYLQ